MFEAGNAVVFCIDVMPVTHRRINFTPTEDAHIAQQGICQSWLLSTSYAGHQVRRTSPAHQTSLERCAYPEACLLYAAETFPDYNLRKYIQQRVVDLQSTSDAANGISKLQEMVRVWERQAAIYQRYARPQKGVMVRSSFTEQSRSDASRWPIMLL